MLATSALLTTALLTALTTALLATSALLATALLTALASTLLTASLLATAALLTLLSPTLLTPATLPLLLALLLSLLLLSLLLLALLLLLGLLLLLLTLGRCRWLRLTLRVTCCKIVVLHIVAVGALSVSLDSNALVGRTGGTTGRRALREKVRGHGERVAESIEGDRARILGGGAVHLNGRHLAKAAASRGSGVAGGLGFGIFDCTVVVAVRRPIGNSVGNPFLGCRALRLRLSFFNREHAGVRILGAAADTERLGATGRLCLGGLDGAVAVVVGCSLGDPALGRGTLGLRLIFFHDEFSVCSTRSGAADAGSGRAGIGLRHAGAALDEGNNGIALCRSHCGQFRIIVPERDGNR